MIRDELFKKVRQILKEDGTVLFVGSGISAWSGLPGWGKLLEDMAEYVDKCGKDSSGIRDFKNTQPLIAADHGRSQLTREQYHRFLKEEFHREKRYSVPSQVHELLMNLGVSCFITTNYDRLLENTLKQRHMLRRYQVVTNQEPDRCAQLLSIKSRNFIFKPHGDIEHPESIVLSNTQYDELYESGTRTYAYRALENLLVSRKIIFIGFGLTDPDFLRIMGRFRNEYKGPVSENYAIMPDVSPAQAQYWKDTYGINILTYQTCLTPNGRDFGQLPVLLKALAPGAGNAASRSGNMAGTAGRSKDLTGTAGRNGYAAGASSRSDGLTGMAPGAAKRFVITARQKEALGYYAQSLKVRLKVEEGEIFPLNVRRLPAIGEKDGRMKEGKECTTEDILEEEPGRSFLLTGSPGGGKSFFLKRYCIKMAENLVRWLQGEKSGPMPPVPVYIDLKNYSGAGSIQQMILEQFPAVIPVLQWIEKNKVFLVFDSYNEVDVRFQENLSCCREIESYGIGENRIIASRYQEGFSLLLGEYRMQEVEEGYVEDYLASHGICREELPARVWELLTVPLILKLLKSGRVNVEELGSIREIYESYFQYLSGRLTERFGIEESEAGWSAVGKMTKGLSPALMDMLDGFALRLFEEGRETFSLQELEEAVGKSAVFHPSYNVKEMINFLIDDENFLTPLRNGRISFFHQSMTEFLAARSLAGMRAEKRNMEDKLKDVRWNYIVLFLVSFLDADETQEYIAMLLETDSLLAVQASVYVKEGREEAASQILNYLCCEGPKKSYEYCADLEELDEIPPFTKQHGAGLCKLMKTGDLLGGTAAKWLLHVYGEEVKDELLEEVFRHCFEDFNYVTRIAGVLYPFITMEDYRTIVKWLGASVREVRDGEVYGLSILAAGLPLEKVTEIFRSEPTLKPAQVKLFGDILEEAQSKEAFSLCLNMFQQGVWEIIYPLYFYVDFYWDIASAVYREEMAPWLLDELMEMVEYGEDRWAIGAVYELYQKSSAFAREVRNRLKASTGLERLTLLYAIGKNRKKSFYSLYRNMLYWKELPYSLIGAFEKAGWEEQVDGIVELLSAQGRAEELAGFLGALFGILNRSEERNISLATAGRLLEALVECKDSWDKYAIGSFLGSSCGKEDFLRLYHCFEGKLQSQCNYYVLPYIRSLRMEDFTWEEINRMLQDMGGVCLEQVGYENEILLANIADPQFLEEKIMPLLKSGNKKEQDNARRVLEAAGVKHGRRYIAR